MPFRTPLLLVALLAFSDVALAVEPPRLSAEQLANAIRTDTLTIPTPGELFAALDKPGKPNWQTQYRAPVHP